MSSLTYCYRGTASLQRHRLRKIAALGTRSTSWGFTPAALLGATLTVCRTHYGQSSCNTVQYTEKSGHNIQLSSVCRAVNMFTTYRAKQYFIHLFIFSTYALQPSRLIVRSRLDFPTFATRRLHACHHARAPSSGRWNRGREMSENFAYFFNLRTAAFKAYCAMSVRLSNFRHQASPRVSPRESAQRRKMEPWARNVREFCLICRFTRYI